MLLIFLVACGVVFAEGIVCPTDYCAKNYDTSCPDLRGCQGKIKPNGGFCGCCDICVQTLGENESCVYFYLMGVFSGQECGAGLHCGRVSKTCVRTIEKRQVATGPCTLRQQQLNQGLPLLGVQQLKCNVDGSYKPVQCQGSVCYCVDQDGVEIQGYRTNIGADDYATKNCQCARDEANFIKSGLRGQIFNCEANGNYQQYRCMGSVCFCVDDNGKKIGTQTVTIGLLSTLKCSK